MTLHRIPKTDSYPRSQRGKGKEGMVSFLEALGEQNFVTLILDMVHLSTNVAGHKSLEH